MASSPLLVIRADATAAMGVGHVMRCLSLAQAWAGAGGRAVFLSHCESEHLRKLIAASGFGFAALTRASADPAELDALSALLPVESAWVVLDGYHFDDAYQTAIRALGCRLAVLDDMNHLARYDADVVLNQNPNAASLPYNTKALLLAGTEYALLREEFLQRRPAARQHSAHVRNVLVSMGGGDGRGAISVALGLLRNVECDEVRVALGPASPAAVDFEPHGDRQWAGRVRLLRCPDMPELMAWADAALSAAGSTCWELAFMGVPAALIVLADNQARIAARLHESGAALNLGRLEDLRADAVPALRRFFDSPDVRSGLSCRAQALVDGRGAERVVRILREMS